MEIESRTAVDYIILRFRFEPEVCPMSALYSCIPTERKQEVNLNSQECL